jgi:hypothetical protein
MKRSIFIVALIVAALFDQVARADTDPPFECFSSPEEVHAAHPGSHAVYTAHATWWTESSKCWHVGKPVAKPKTKPPVAASAASKYIAQTPPLQPMQEVRATYEEAAVALFAMMFGPDPSSRQASSSARDRGSPNDFEGRFSALANTSTF